MTRFTKLFSLPVIAGLLLTGCSDSGGGSSDSNPGISLTCGTTLQITDAVPLSTLENTISAIQKNSTADLKWTSSDENVIKITNTTSAAPKLIIYQEGTSTLAVSFTENGSTYSAECNATVTFKDASESSPSFSVDEVADHYATINWSAADNVTYEKFLLLTYKGTDLLSKEELGSSAVTKALSALDSETEYTAKLYGIFSNGSEYTVSSKTFTTLEDTTAPGSVTFNEEKITASAAEEAITLYWSNPADTDLAKIVISISSTEDSTVFDDIELTTASFLKAGAANLSKKITGLMDSLEGTPYSFTIKTYDTSDLHAEANDVTKTFTTKADPAPGNVTFTSYSSTESSITVNWTNPADTDITSAEISITSTEDTRTDLSSLSASLTGSKYKTANAECSYSFSNLLTDGTDGFAYTITVTLTDSHQHKNSGTAQTVNTSKDVTAPGEVNITYVKTRASSITVTWTNPSDSDFTKTTASIYDSSASIIGEAVTQTGSAGASQNCSFTELTEGETYSVVIQTVDEWGNTSTGTTKTITAENPAVSSVSAVTGFSGQAVVSWTDCDEDGLSYIVSAQSQTSGATIPDPITVASGKEKIAVSGLDIGTAYTFTVTPKDDEGTYTAVKSSSLSPVAVIWQLKSGYNEKMIHPAVLVEDYSKGYVTASSMHIIASDHSDKADGPDVSRSSAKYDNWVVLPGLADPTNPDYFSLVADATQKYSADTTGATSTVPSPSSYYIYFDTEGTHAPIPAGSAYSSWGGSSLDANNAESNRMWIGGKSEISDPDNATFYIVEQSDVTKNPTGEHDIPDYEPYVYFKSTGGLFWQHSFCTFLGVSQVNDTPCAAIARQIYTYSGAITLPE
ncbi:hypothetical protein HNP77_001155 [Treponema rectale]|uniref:Fibronectin type-III domain-containing protein n=1 Tax=Treponema rectale TaxID=744512 RepID=A0A840SFV0_9SPIR|nr:fibronectin type III domain-containing protein [Treponema rectale]MBB5218786.1 hypothetical protein [Treponema rectale]